MEYIPRQQLQLEILERNEFQTLPRLGFTMPAASDEYIHSRYRDGFQRLRRLNESLTGRVSSLEADVRSLTAHNGELLANYSTDLAAAESSVQEKTQQLEQRHREEKEKWLEAERTLKVRLSKVQGELRSREDTLAVERQESGESYNELKERYSQELAKKSGRIKELEERVRQCTAEMERQKSLRETTGQELKKCQLELEATKRDQSKANEIIRKLQEEVKASRDKVDILNQVSRQIA